MECNHHYVLPVYVFEGLFPFILASKMHFGKSGQQRHITAYICVCHASPACPADHVFPFCFCKVKGPIPQRYCVHSDALWECPLLKVLYK